MGRHTEAPAAISEPEPSGKRLDSWKAIAAHVNRHVTTVRRWEKQEGLPVHRHLHTKLGSIYAYASELDAWLYSRRRDDAAVVDSLTSSEFPESSGRLPPPPSIAGLPAWPTDMFGRDAELNSLEAAWVLACGQQQQVILIVGEPGVGKTRLALEFARSVATHSTVLAGGCDREALVPFAPFITMLQWLVRVTPAHTLRRRLTEITGSVELAQIVPEITTRIHLDEQPIAASMEGHRYRMFDAFAQLLVVASRERPILLLFEDVHWADQGSMLFLRHLIRSTAKAALCIVLTCRDNEPEHALEAGEILEDLRREYSATRLTLKGLADDHVRHFVESWVGPEMPPWLAPFVVQNTEGNPLFVTEMLRHLDEAGGLTRLDSNEAPAGFADVGLSQGIRELIGRRLARLSQTTRRLLTFAAVIGREFNLSVVEALAETDEEAVLDAMDEALTARIITEEPGAPGIFSFSHTLIRQTLYSGITAARRVRLHYRIASALELQSAPDGPPLRELAYHFGEAAVYKSAEKAVEYGVRAGDQASTALALEDAARCYEIALRA